MQKRKIQLYDVVFLKGMKQSGFYIVDSIWPTTQQLPPKYVVHALETATTTTAPLRACYVVNPNEIDIKYEVHPPITSFIKLHGMQVGSRVVMAATIDGKIGRAHV